MASHILHTRPPVGEVAPPSLSHEAEAIARVLEDAAHYPGGSASVVATPASEGEIAWLLRTYEALLPIGAQSSLTGGATPFEDVVISTQALASIGAPAGGTVRVGAGVPLATLQDALDPLGLFYPPVPTFTGASVGGVVATNAAGASTVRYGSTRDWVDALTVVLASGDVLDIARGETIASAEGHFEIVTSDGPVRVDVPRIVMPRVPKRSAGYFAAAGMDLIDLFIGSEGTLGVVTGASLRVARTPPGRWLALVQCPDEPRASSIVRALRERMQGDRAGGGPLAVSAIEHMDALCLAILQEDKVPARLNVDLADDTAIVMLVEVEDARPHSRDESWAELDHALDDPMAETPIGQLCAVLRAWGVFDTAEVVLPADRERRAQLLAFREAVPEAVNRRVGRAQREIDGRISKVAGDFIVSLDRFDEMMDVVRGAMDRRGLDAATWGHISDGNIHPNVIPRSIDDVVAGKAALIEAGGAVIRLGGCPLAEHGVGRNPVKQRLLEMLYGADGVADMRRVKIALDPRRKLARDILFKG